jgi:hypothetical protein
MWTTARFLPTSLFSLRPALSTASGAQSLLVPTPFAIKMALVNAAIRLYGMERTIGWWPAIRELAVAIELPDVIVVNKTFIKIQRPTRVNKGDPVEMEAVLAEGIYPMGPTIAFREFVQFGGEVSLALRTAGSIELPLDRLLTQVNYLGKRGGFWQLQDAPASVEMLPETWTLLTAPATSFVIDGTLQMLDDCGSRLTWEHVNTFTAKSIKLGGDERVLRTIVLPYRLRRSSYRYTLYERIA